jgi:hypothetical protein
MKQVRVAFVVLCSGVLVSCKESVVDTSASSFQVGQVWAYTTRKGESGSTLIVNRIQRLPDMTNVVHISINGIRLEVGKVENRPQTFLPHLPIAEAALRRSVTTLVTSRPADSRYLEGFDLWRSSYERGQAGIWETSLAKTLDTLESSYTLPTKVIEKLNK